MSGSIKKSLPKDYCHALNHIVDDIFEVATDVYDYSWNELAERAKLAPQTVGNLGQYITRLPRLFTVWKLAKAVGMEIVVAGKHPKLVRKGA